MQGPDEQGEICIKSPQCFKGYLNQGNLLKGIDNCLDQMRQTLTNSYALTVMFSIPFNQLPWFELR